MNLHCMATVITPNLFRPFELTANDLIFAQHLVETFKIMMSQYSEIFNVVEEEEEDLEILVNSINGINAINTSHKPLIMEEEEEDDNSVKQVFNNHNNNNNQK